MITHRDGKLVVQCDANTFERPVPLREADGWKKTIPSGRRHFCPEHAAGIRTPLADFTAEERARLAEAGE